MKGTGGVALAMVAAAILLSADPTSAGEEARAAPAWLAGKPLNEWFAIPGTAGAGGAPVDDFSGDLPPGNESR